MWDVRSLLFPATTVCVGGGKEETVFDFRVHRPAYCLPAGERLWKDRQEDYERFSQHIRKSSSLQQYLDEIELVREIYTEEYHISGSVLDVGGHQGRLRHYLEDDSKFYVFIDSL